MEISNLKNLLWFCSKLAKYNFTWTYPKIFLYWSYTVLLTVNQASVWVDNKNGFFSLQKMYVGIASPLPVVETNKYVYTVHCTYITIHQIPLYIFFLSPSKLNSFNKIFLFFKSFLSAFFYRHRRRLRCQPLAK